MKELFDRLKTLKIDVIFYQHTDNIFVQLFRYVFVGGLAFVADWGMLVFFAWIFRYQCIYRYSICISIWTCCEFCFIKDFCFSRGFRKNWEIWWIHSIWSDWCFRITFYRDDYVAVTKNRNYLYDRKDYSSSHRFNMEFCGEKSVTV